MSEYQHRMACPECMAVFHYDDHDQLLRCPFCGRDDSELLEGESLGDYEPCPDCRGDGWVLK